MFTCFITNYFYFIVDSIQKAKSASLQHRKNVFLKNIEYAQTELRQMTGEPYPKKSKPIFTYRKYVRKGKGDDFVFSSELDKSISLSQSTMSDTSINTSDQCIPVTSHSASLTQDTINFNILSQNDTKDVEETSFECKPVQIKEEAESDDELYSSITIVKQEYC